jgi:CRISPR-associated endonuclease/helicase Cas3
MIDYRRFWGKARPSDKNGRRCHPVAWHLLDVAASVRAIMDVRPRSRHAGARLLRCTEEEATDILASLAVLHDIGKFAPCFQLKAPDCWPDELGDIDDYTLLGKGHPTDGWMMWLRGISLPSAHSVLSAPNSEPLVLAALGHHGRPIVIDGVQTFNTTMIQPSVEACLADLLPLASGTPLPAPATRSENQLASWWVNGIITLADWIGSGSEFRYESDAHVPAEYWELAKVRASVAIARAGVAQSKSAARRNFTTLTGKEHATPMQAWAEHVELAHGPLLIILEDVTGSGKTEAAQVIVHRLMASGRASGAYWAMPTQATANAMYTRQRNAISQLFDESSRPSLVLAHAQSRLNPSFRRDVLAGVADTAHPDEIAADDDNAPSSTAMCSAWLADNRRASLLADVGAGTIDQALLGILPSSFNTLRLAGLADKVLVVDEAHAYEAYVAEELYQLLRLQAANGGHAIVLSATLRQADRQKFAREWRAGLLAAQAVAPSPASSQAFPLATMVSGAENGVEEYPVAPAESSRHSLGLTPIYDVESACALVAAACARGAAVAWIRNTVTSCMEAASLLRNMGLETVVLHSRFAQGDRQIIEAQLTNDFGVRATKASRAGRVVVATQVIEQSLDLDFDVMISDLAPLDLLLQRAGRLWRHRHRDAERGKCTRTLHVLTPALHELVNAKWPEPLLRGTPYVYPHVGVLWNTAQIVAGSSAVRIPEDSRVLIERAYGDGDVPDILAPPQDRARGRDSAGRETARYVSIKAADGYLGDGQKWTNELKVETRLTEVTVVLRLARRNAEGRLVAWCDGYADVVDPWAASEVRVRAASMGGSDVRNVGSEHDIQRVVSLWPEYEQQYPVVVLERTDGDWRGEVLVGGKRKQIVAYSGTGGLGISRDG